MTYTILMIAVLRMLYYTSLVIVLLLVTFGWDISCSSESSAPQLAPAKP